MKQPKTMFARKIVFTSVRLIVDELWLSHFIIPMVMIEKIKEALSSSTVAILSGSLSALLAKVLTELGLPVFEAIYKTVTPKVMLYLYLLALINLAIALTFLLHFRRKLHEKLKLKFFMKWDRLKNPHCPKCETPLTHQGFDRNGHDNLFCNKCRENHYPRDEHGKTMKLTEAQKLI